MSGSGKLYIVGIGPGSYEDMTVRAVRALNDSQVIVGYTVYTDIVKQYFQGKEMIATPMRTEVDRCNTALEEARKGRTVSLVCSGDPGVYGMAGPAMELWSRYPEVDVEVVPGVTAACAGAACLGAPICHDFAIISLSDLLTPMSLIEKRLGQAAMGDMIVCLYNPASRKRRDHLRRACEVMLRHKRPDTVCGVVKNIGREGYLSEVTTLECLAEMQADMFTTIFIGNSHTYAVDGKLVTPRGYRDV